MKNSIMNVLEIDIIGNSSQKILIVLSGDFFKCLVAKRHPDVLLAKTKVFGIGRVNRMLYLSAYHISFYSCNISGCFYAMGTS